MIKINFPNPVVTKADFFDRDKVLDGIKRTLQRGERNITIKGERVIGKTSLLNIVQEWLTEEEVAIVLPLPQCLSLQDFQSEIIDQIKGATLPEEAYLTDSSEPFRSRTFSYFVQTARHLFQKRPRQHYVAIIDEFDSMLQKSDEAEKIVNFVGYLVEKPRLPIQFIFTMTTIPDVVRHSIASPYLTSSNLIQLDPWPADLTRQFVEWLLKGNFTIDNDAHSAIFSAGGGHPYFTKALLDTLLQEWRDPGENAAITPTHLTKATQAAARRHEVDFTLTNIMGVHISQEEAALLKHSNLSTTGLTENALIEQLGSHYLMVAEKLVKRGLLLPKGGVFHPRIGIIQKWLANAIFDAFPIRPVGNDHQPTMPYPTSGEEGGEPGSGIVVNETTRRVWVEGSQELVLTKTEYNVFLALAERSGDVLSMDELAEAGWSEGELETPGDDNIYTIISRIRKKLKELSDFTYLENRPRQGYILNKATVTRFKG